MAVAKINSSFIGLPEVVKVDLGFTTRQIQYEAPEVDAGFTHAFGLLYLSCDSVMLSSFTREYHCIIVDERQYFILRAIVKIEGKKLISYGASFNLNMASDVSCHFLSKLIQEKMPSFFMPKHLIGYPNLRGHCYLISALLPLMHSYPFVNFIFQNLFEYQRLCNIGSCSEDLAKRTDPESPNYWIATIGRVYRDYRKVAQKSSISFHNVPYLAHHKLKVEEFADMKDVPETSKKPSDDLTLDRSLIKGLCSSLSTYSSDIYKTPGGDERVAYNHIMRKLGSEINGFNERFFLKIKFTFTCGSCVGGPYSGVTNLPVIKSSLETNFEYLLHNAIFLMQEQQLRYPHKIKGAVCCERSRLIMKAEFMNHPDILCFGVQNGNTKNSVRIPDKLKLSVNGLSKNYIRLASSVCIKCYVSADGKDYGCFYHPFEEGDKSIAEHTFLHFRTKKGFVEVNDGYLFTLDKRVSRQVTPCSIHYYQLDTYAEFLPDVDNSIIMKNPML